MPHSSHGRGMVFVRISLRSPLSIGICVDFFPKESIVIFTTSVDDLEMDDERLASMQEAAEVFDCFLPIASNAKTVPILRVDRCPALFLFLG